MKSFLLLGVMLFLFFNAFGQRIKIDTITKMSMEFPPQPKEGLQHFKITCLMNLRYQGKWRIEGLMGR